MLTLAHVVFRVPERNQPARVVHRGREEALHVDRVVAGDLLRRQRAVVEADGVDLAIPAVVRASRIHRAPAERDAVVTRIPRVTQSGRHLRRAVGVDLGDGIVVVVRRHEGIRLVASRLRVERGLLPVEIDPVERVCVLVVERDVPGLRSAPEQDAAAPRRLLEQDLDRLVRGRGLASVGRRQTCRPRVHVEADATPPLRAAPCDNGQVIVADKVFPDGRRRIVRAGADVVDTVPLRNQTVLHVARARVGRGVRHPQCQRRNRGGHRHPLFHGLTFRICLRTKDKGLMTKDCCSILCPPSSVLCPFSNRTWRYHITLRPFPASRNPLPICKSTIYVRNDISGR